MYFQIKNSNPFFSNIKNIEIYTKNRKLINNKVSVLWQQLLLQKQKGLQKISIQKSKA